MDLLTSYCCNQNEAHLISPQYCHALIQFPPFFPTVKEKSKTSSSPSFSPVHCSQVLSSPTLQVSICSKQRHSFHCLRSHQLSNMKLNLSGRPSIPTTLKYNTITCRSSFPINSDIIAVISYINTNLCCWSTAVFKVKFGFVPPVAAKAMTEYDKYRNLQKVFVKVSFITLRKLPNCRTMRTHTLKLITLNHRNMQTITMWMRISVAPRNAKVMTIHHLANNDPQRLNLHLCQDSSNTWDCAPVIFQTRFQPQLTNYLQSTTRFIRSTINCKHKTVFGSANRPPELESTHRGPCNSSSRHHNAIPRPIYQLTGAHR